MKSSLSARLSNDPFGDPGLHIQLRWQGAAIQFDLGRIDRFPAGELLKLTQVFVSHTHMDHFYGFDRLLRLFLSRDATVHLYGPPGIAANVIGKLAGYTWNLVDGYPFVLIVHEVGRDRVETLRFAATDAFKPAPLGSRHFDGILHENPRWRVRTAHLDHRIPCLGFAIEEADHLNVKSGELERRGLLPGRWLNELKDAIRTGLPDTTEITATAAGEPRSERRLRLGELRDDLLMLTAGRKISYVVDTLFSEGNARRIVDLARDSDVFYCESPFLDRDRNEAIKRYHLTARQAGTLARMAEAKRLEVFHFSPRYEGEAGALYAEAKATFRGELAPDVPVPGS